MSSLSITSGDIMTVYLDDETENGVTITKISGLVGFSGLDIYSNYLITRSDNGVALTGPDVQTADGTGVDVGSSTNDISVIYDPLVSTTIHVWGNLYVPVGHSFTTSGSLQAAEDAYVDGTLNVAANTMTAGGDLIITGTFTHSNVLTFNPVTTFGDQLFNPGPNVIGSRIQISNTVGTVSLTGNALSNGANYIQISTGSIFDFGTQNVTSTGSFSNTGTVKLAGSQTISLTQDTDSGLWMYTGDNDGTVDTFTIKDFGTTDYYNLQFNDVSATSDIFEVSETGAIDLAVANDLTVTDGQLSLNTKYLDIGRDVTIASAGLVVASGSANDRIEVARNWSNTGTFTPGLSYVIFDPNVNHTITGSTTFYLLNASDTAAIAGNSTVTFESGSTQTISGFLAMTGTN